MSRFLKNSLTNSTTFRKNFFNETHNGSRSARNLFQSRIHRGRRFNVHFVNSYFGVCMGKARGPGPVKVWPRDLQWSVS